MIPVSLVSVFIYMPSHQEHLKFLVGFLPMFMPLFGLGIWAASLAAGKQGQPWERQIARWAVAGVITTLLFVIATERSAVHPVLRRFVITTLLFVIAFAPLEMTAFMIKSALLRLITWGPFCFFLVLAATQEGQVRRFVSWHPFVWVGTFSYSLYLTHEPFLYMAEALILPHHWSLGLVLLCQIVVLPTVLIGFGYLFFLVAEKPFLRRPVKRAIEAEQHGLKAGGPAGGVGEGGMRRS